MRILDPPRKLTQGVLDFCSRISAETPFFVDVEPSADSKQGYCFDNVARQVDRHGGSVAYGWAIWHWPGRYFEAQHHGVWRNTAGDFLDVSPQLNGRRRVLFLPDPAARYDPAAFRNNILGAQDDDPIGTEFINAGRECLAILGRYRKPGVMHPNISLSDSFRLAMLKSKMETLALRM